MALGPLRFRLLAPHLLNLLLQHRARFLTPRNALLQRLVFFLNSCSASGDSIDIFDQFRRIHVVLHPLHLLRRLGFAQCSLKRISVAARRFPVAAFGRLSVLRLFGFTNRCNLVFQIALLPHQFFAIRFEAHLDFVHLRLHRFEAAPQSDQLSLVALASLLHNAELRRALLQRFLRPLTLPRKHIVDRTLSSQRHVHFVPIIVRNSEQARHRGMYKFIRFCKRFETKLRHEDEPTSKVNLKDRRSVHHTFRI